MTAHSASPNVPMLRTLLRLTAWLADHPELPAVGDVWVTEQVSFTVNTLAEVDAVRHALWQVQVRVFAISDGLHLHVEGLAVTRDEATPLVIRATVWLSGGEGQRLREALGFPRWDELHSLVIPAEVLERVATTGRAA